MARQLAVVPFVPVRCASTSSNAGPFSPSSGGGKPASESFGRASIGASSLASAGSEMVLVLVEAEGWLVGWALELAFGVDIVILATLAVSCSLSDV